MAYNSISFVAPDQAGQYQQNMTNAAALQQSAMNPNVQQGGQESWTQNMAQLAQALAAARLRQRAANMAQPMQPTYAGPAPDYGNA